MKHVEKKYIAMWVTLVVASTVVLLSILFYKVVLEQLRIATKFFVWDASFSGIVIPFVIFFFENAVYAFSCKGIFKRTKCYWLNTQKQLTFAILLHLCCTMLRAIGIIALGIWWKEPAAEIFELLIEEVSHHCANMLPYMLIILPYAFSLSHVREDIVIVRAGGKAYILLSEFELDGQVFYLLVPRRRWRRRALMFRKVERDVDGKYLTVLTKEEFIDAYLHMRGFIDGYLQGRSVKRVS